MYDYYLATLIRQGHIIACGRAYKLKLKLSPELLESVVTRPAQVKVGDWDKVIFRGEMSDEERAFWRPHL